MKKVCVSDYLTFNLIKQIPLILKPRIVIYICSFLMILFLPKYMINVTLKHDNFDSEIVNFPFLDGDVPCSTSYFSIHPIC